MRDSILGAWEVITKERERPEAQEFGAILFKEDLINSIRQCIKFQQQLLIELNNVSIMQLQDPVLRENLILFLIGYDSLNFTIEEYWSIKNYAIKILGNETFKKAEELGGISGLWPYRSILPKILIQLGEREFLEANSGVVHRAILGTYKNLLNAGRQWAEDEDQTNFRKIMPPSFDHYGNPGEDVFSMFIRYGASEKDAVKYCRHFLFLVPYSFMLAKEYVYAGYLPFIETEIRPFSETLQA